jgi:protein-tyrosine phosphatase
MVINTYWVTGTGPLHLATMPCPRGGEWLETDMRALQAEYVDILVSLLTAEEITELDLSQEPEQCQIHGIEYRSFPIRDHDVPPGFPSVLDFARKLERELSAGKAIAIHCRAGIGRSSLLAACVLIISGKSAIDAFNQIRQARGCHVPDTGAQFDWVQEFARHLALDRNKGPV